jgi:hypothetical protein
VLGICGNACEVGDDCDGIAQDGVKKEVFEGEMFL